MNIIFKLQNNKQGIIRKQKNYVYKQKVRKLLWHEQRHFQELTKRRLCNIWYNRKINYNVRKYYQQLSKLLYLWQQEIKTNLNDKWNSQSDVKKIKTKTKKITKHRAGGQDKIREIQGNWSLESIYDTFSTNKNNKEEIGIKRSKPASTSLKKAV